MANGTAGSGPPSEPPDETRARTVAALISEGLFVVLPLVVVALAAANRGSGAWRILESPDWSFAAVVFLGQSVVKLIQGVGARGSMRLRVEAAVVIASIVIVVFLVPALLILAFIQGVDHPPEWLVIAQLVMFVASVLLFALVGAIAHAAISAGRPQSPPVRPSNSTNA